MNKPHSVSVYITVRNEEHRIESCLRSLAWADEIYVFDKSSTDNTVDLASKYASEVVVIPNDDTKQGDKYVKKYGTGQWCLFVTASDIFSKELPRRVTELLQTHDFREKAIALPYRHYIFGCFLKNSPLESDFKTVLIHRDALVINKIVHQEIDHISGKTFLLKPRNEFQYVYHFSTPTVNDFLAKITRYLQLEASPNANLRSRRVIKDILKLIISSVIKKRIILYGKDGLAVFCAALSYKLLKFVLAWETERNAKTNQNVVELYKKLSNHYGYGDVED